MGAGGEDKITFGQALTWLGAAHFDGHGPELRYEIDTGRLIADLNGDGHADGFVLLAPGTALTAQDFL